MALVALPRDPRRSLGGCRRSAGWVARAWVGRRSYSSTGVGRPARDARRSLGARPGGLTIAAAGQLLRSQLPRLTSGARITPSWPVRRSPREPWRSVSAGPGMPLDRGTRSQRSANSSGPTPGQDRRRRCDLDADCVAAGRGSAAVRRDNARAEAGRDRHDGDHQTAEALPWMTAAPAGGVRFATHGRSWWRRCWPPPRRSRPVLPSPAARRRPDDRSAAVTGRRGGHRAARRARRRGSPGAPGCAG